MFKGRQFDQSVILLCVPWYLSYNLSLRDLEEMMAERGIAVDQTTIHRWTIRYSPLCGCADTVLSHIVLPGFKFRRFPFAAKAAAD